MDGRVERERKKERERGKGKRCGVVWCLEVRGEELDSMTQGNQSNERD